MKISIESKQKYILVYVKGEIDLQKAKELFVRLLGVCVEKKLFNVIVDYREVVGYITTMDRLDYLKNIDALHKTYLNLNMPKLRIAYLAPSDIKITESIVSDQRESLTFDNMATHDIETAEKWILN